MKLSIKTRLFFINVTILNIWKSHRFSDNNYTCLLTEDLKIRYYMNNVHYYLKLPSSDLTVRRPQNKRNLKYTNAVCLNYSCQISFYFINYRALMIIFILSFNLLESNYSLYKYPIINI